MTFANVKQLPVVLIFAGVLAAVPAADANVTRAGFDLRATSAAPRTLASARAARRELRSTLGARALLPVDRATGRPRVLGRLDGALTGPSGDTGAQIARRYLRRHAAIYGLTEAQIADLRIGAQRRAATGLASVQLTQSFGGVTSIDSGVRAVLDGNGRLVELVGSPDPDLAAAGTQAKVSRSRAAELAAHASGAPDRAATARVSAVIFHVGARARLGWRALVAAGPRQLDDVLVDATTGAVVRRVNRVVSANAASVYPAWPGAPHGGSATTVDLAPYLDTPGAPTKLEGPNAYAFTDAPDAVPTFGPFGVTSHPAPGSDVGPSGGKDFVYPLRGFTLGVEHCPTAGATCTWDPSKPFSWQDNREQDAVQLFWHVNAFHDHLAAPPIGFVAADGAFEDDDPVIAQSMDGADTARGLPDDFHSDNASFLALPDGEASFMSILLVGAAPGPFGPSPLFSLSGSNDATTVYHEYTHGMSGRLVTDAQGFDALFTAQAGAMGEAWSDWYAFDALDRDANLADAPGVADVRLAAYQTGDHDLLRSQPIDCPVGAEPACPGSPTAGAGGYTFGDLGKVAGFPEVHADGEIWGQTLWQLRDALIADHGRAAGIARAERLVTDAMRLSPPEPSFLDQRNAILQADANDAPAGQDAATIWAVFASRGMGWFASTSSSSDVRVIEDFSLPPTTGDATVRGTVRDDGAHELPGVAVGFGGHDTGLGPDLSSTTDAHGAFAIASVPSGTYPRLRAQAPAGFLDAVAGDVSVPPTGTVTRDLLVRRNWASGAGGALVRGFTGSDYSDIGCGPAQLIDDDPGTAWGVDAPDAPGLGGPKQIVLALPADVTVTAIAIDPGPGCGLGDEAQLGSYRVKVAADDDGDPGHFSTVATGTFGPADIGAARDLPLSATTPGVRYVELQVLGNHGDPIGTTPAEMQVFGHPTTAAELAPAAAATPAAPPTKGDAGAPGPAGPVGARGPRSRSVPKVTCKLRGTRTIDCAFSTRAGAIAGARARLSYHRRTIATGRVRGRALRLRTRQAVRHGRHILTITRGRGRSATVRQMAVKL
jgi:extracellular elastinolytic metalloproteinase